MARSWSLGGTTLPNADGFKREPFEVSAQHTTTTGKTVRQVTAIKTRYTINWKHLTQTQRDVFWSLYTGTQPLTFSVTDGSLSVPAVSVLMTVTDESFKDKGSEFREHITINLTEVQ